MREQINTIREALTLSTDGPIIGRDDMVQKALTALTQLERMVGEPVAKLHDDGYWTPMKTEAGRALNERLMRAGSPSIEVYTAAPPAQQPQEIEVQCPVCSHKFYEWPNDKQPQYEAGDMASAHNDGFRAGVASVAQQPQAEAVPAVTDGMALAFHHALTDGAIGQSELEDIKTGLRAALAPQQAEAVPSDVVRDAERYRWLRNESWAGYNTGKGTPSVYTVDGAGNRRMMLAEEAMDEAIDAAMAQGEKP